MSVTAIFPQIIWPQSRATDRRHLRLVLSAPRPIPAFPTPLRRVIGHHHWPWYRLARANRFSGSRRPPSTTEAPTKATGATLMRIDLKNVNAEITGLRSKLATICSVASRNVPSLASAPAGDDWGLALCCRSALSPARASGPPKASNISSRRPIGFRMDRPASRR